MGIDEIVSRIVSATGVSPKRRSNGEYVLRCPAHDDKIPSLYARPIGDRVLLKCFGGCTLDKVLGVIGLEPKDLFLNGATDKLRSKDVSDVEDVYVYVDESNKPLYRVVRRRGKVFSFERYENGRYVPGKAKDTRKVLYRLPEVKEAISQGKPVYYVEGEKDADVLGLHGVVATTHAGGANAWDDNYADSLTGAKQVYVVRDMDVPGLSMALAIRRALRERGVPVTILEPRWGKDVAEHLLYGSVADLRPYTSRSVVLSSVVAETPEFVVYPYLPRGAVTMLDGRMGIGKTYFALKVASAVTRGERLLEGKGNMGVAVQGKVLYVSFEDDPAIILKPRLTSLGAEMSRFYAFEPGKTGIEGIEEILLEAETIKADLIVIDPFFLLVADDVNLYKSASEVMGYLARMARTQKFALLAVRHTTKAEKTEVLSKGLGSVGWLASARSGLLAEREDDRLRIRHIKHNWSDGMPDVWAVLTKDKGIRLEWADEPPKTAEGSTSDLFSGWDEVSAEDYQEFLEEEWNKLRR